MAGLLDMNPQQYGLLMTGLGMLQNNRGKSLGEAFAAGGMQGANGMMDMQQAQQLQALKDLQMQKAQAETERQRKQDSREDNLRTSMQGIDPADNNAISKALFDAGMYEDAIKLKRGNGLMGGGDFQFMSGPDGRVIVGDKNAGSLKWGDIGGSPVAMGVYDPATQQRIADVKAGAKIDQVPMANGSTVTTRMRNVPTVTMTPEQEAAEIARLNATDPRAMSQSDYQAQIGISQTPGAKKVQEEQGKATAEAQQSLNSRIAALQGIIDEADLGVKALDAKFDNNGKPIGYGLETGGMFPGVREWANETVLNDPRYRDISTAAAGGKLQAAIQFLKGQGQITEGERALVGEQLGIDPFRQSSKNNYERLTRIRSNADKAIQALRNNAKGDFSEVGKLSDDALLNKYLGK